MLFAGLEMNCQRCSFWRCFLVTWAWVVCVIVAQYENYFSLYDLWHTTTINNTHIDGFLMEPVDLTYTRNIYFTVKTSRKYFHKRLLPLALTWLQVVDKNKVSIITDKSIPDQLYLENAGFHVINTDCASIHKFIPLCCKLGTEFAAYYEAVERHPGKEDNYQWYCHSDDDMYVNVPLLSQLLQRYDSHKPYYFGRLPLTQRHLSPNKEVILTDEKLNNLRRTSYTLKHTKFHYSTGAFFCISYALMMQAKQFFNGPEPFIAVSKPIHDSDDVTAGFVIDALLGYKLTEMDAIKNEYDAEMLHASLSDFTNKYVTVSHIEHVTTSLKEFRSLKEFASSLRTSLSPDPTGFLLYHCLLYPTVSWCPRSK